MVAQAGVRVYGAGSRVSGCVVFHGCGPGSLSIVSQ